MHKKIISTIVLGSILLNPLVSNANTKLGDIDNHWANKEINEFISKGYISGYPEDNTFRPNNSITRAEFVKITNKYFGFTEGTTTSFDDVKSSDWYYKDIAIAEKAGYINGKSKGQFEPNSPMTREEAAKIVTTITSTIDNNLDKLDKAEDKDKVSNWAKPYVEGALEQGYLIGNEQGLLNPVNNITRAESVSILSRINQRNPNVSNFKTMVTQEFYKLLNEYRKSNGLSPLTSISRLEDMANAWSNHMHTTGVLNHVINGKNANETFPEYGTSDLENIVYTMMAFRNDLSQEYAKNVAEEIISLWKNSPEYNKAMLNNNMNSVGFGFHSIQKGNSWGVYATLELSSSDK